MPHGQIEILGARERRRRWSIEQKLRIVAETEEPGASVSVVGHGQDSRRPPEPGPAASLAGWISSLEHSRRLEHSDAP